MLVSGGSSIPVSLLLFYGSYVEQNHQVTAERNVILTVAYASTDICEEDHPIGVLIENKSERTVIRTYFRVVIWREGFSDNIAKEPTVFYKSKKATYVLRKLGLNKFARSVEKVAKAGDLHYGRGPTFSKGIKGLTVPTSPRRTVWIHEDYRTISKGATVKVADFIKTLAHECEAHYVREMDHPDPPPGRTWPRG